MSRPEDYVVPPNAGRLVWLGGLGARFMLDGERTGGQFALLEHPLKPRALGSPMHTHSREDEYSFVLEGSVGVQIGEAEMVATIGTLILKPRGVPHAFWNATDAPARLLEIISPAGFESYFDALAELFASGPPDPARAEAVRQRYGLEVEMGSVQRLVEKHGLASPT